MLTRRRLRVALAVLVLLAAGVLLAGYVSGSLLDEGVRGNATVEQAFDSGTDEPIVAPRDNVTVVATDSNAFVSDDNDGPRAKAELAAFDTDGSILYYNDSHTRYWDVDPVNGTDATVEYVYADHLSPDECGAETVCTRNGVERVNLTTGETEAIYSRITPGKHSTRWHDVDRVDDERLLVADIARDRVFIVNTTTEIVEWSWDAQSAFSPESGGPYPDDWTHINDVELLEDGRVMVSVRNQDQVVFIDRETGLQEDWTLGSDDDHSTLYEQHNPDYIPESQGGPAVLVADSENSRAVEYQREDGEWTRSWTWRDDRAQWIRDADRLPNGHTLITDSNGDRVVEVNRSGDVVWSADIAFPYESERLATGDESAGGPSAASADLESRVAPAGSGEWGSLRAVFPQKLVNGLIYVLPSWMGPVELLAAIALPILLVPWLIFEYRWSSVTVDLSSPIDIRRR